MLGNPFRFGVGGPGGWVIYDEPEIHLGGAADIFVPDLAGWKRERLSEVAEDAVFTTIVPDWVREVLSPSTQAIDRAEKMEIYGREQVNHVWLVDPIARTLEVYAHADAGWHRLAVFRDDALVRAAPFEVFEFQLRVLWER